MKQTTALLALVLSLLFVAGVTADPIGDAEFHALRDGEDYDAKGWGVLAFGASLVISPLLGGGGVIVAAKLVEPDVAVPPTRLAVAQESYVGNDLMLYAAQYQDSMSGPIQRDRSRRAWIGTGIGLGVRAAVLITLVLILSYGI